LAFVRTSLILANCNLPLKTALECKGCTIEISSLKKLLDSQLALLNLAILVLDEKSIEFEGEKITIEYDHKHTSVLLSLILSAGSSVETIKLISTLPSLRFKDALPISRSVVEGCINASYLLAAGSEATDNAIAHAITKGYRQLDRSAGTGGHKISIKATSEIPIDAQLQKTLDKFTTKKGYQRNWTELSVPQRIVEIEKSFGTKHSMSLNGAYLMVYSNASEVIHGSYFGALLSSGMVPYGQSLESLSEFNVAQENHIESAFLASFLSLTGMLEIFADHFAFNKLKDKLKDNMDAFSLLVKGS
jgi:hypothetical protein